MNTIPAPIAIPQQGGGVKGLEQRAYVMLALFSEVMRSK